VTRGVLAIPAYAGLGTLLGTNVLTGCTPDKTSGSPHRRKTAAAEPPRPDPDRPILNAAAADEERLIGLYRKALSSGSIGRDSTLRARLSTFVRHHEEHLEALRTAAGATPEAAAGDIEARVAPDTEPTRQATASASPSASPQATLVSLVRAEQKAAADRGAVVGAVSGENARLLASIAASETIHAHLLDPDS